MKTPVKIILGLAIVGGCIYGYGQWRMREMFRPPTQAEMAAMDAESERIREERISKQEAAERRASAPSEAMMARMIKEIPVSPRIVLKDLCEARGMKVGDDNPWVFAGLNIMGVNVRLPDTTLVAAARAKGLVGADMAGWMSVSGSSYSYRGADRYMKAPPAYFAGILPGDVVVAVRGLTASGFSDSKLRDILRAAMDLKPGTVIVVTIYRAGPGIGEQFVEVPVRLADGDIAAKDYRPADLVEAHANDIVRSSGVQTVQVVKTSNGVAKSLPLLGNDGRPVAPAEPIAPVVPAPVVAAPVTAPEPMPVISAPPPSDLPLQGMIAPPPKE